MIVFKLYFKIVLTAKFLITVYLGIFMVLAIVTSTTQSPEKIYSNQKIDIAWVDYDQTSLSESLKNYVSNYAVFETIKAEKVDEALFYRDILVYVEIPEGFFANLATANEDSIKTKSVPGAMGSYQIENALNRYLNLARSFKENELYPESLETEIEKALENSTNVLITETKHSNFTNITFFFGYACYIIMALLIPLVGSIMSSLNNLEIKRRNILGSISNSKMQGLLLLSNLALGILLILILLGLGVILYSDTLFTTQGLLFILNAILFSITTITLAYALATIFKSQMMINALGTIISLGLAFITGIFIPQYLLGNSIKTLAQIFPSYWYIKTNNQIQAITSWAYSDMKPFYENLLIQLVFIAIFVGITFFISKKRMRAEI